MSRFSTKFMFLMGVLASVACTTVDPGEVGIEVRFGQIQGGVLPPGMYGSFISDVKTLSTRTQNYTMAGAGTEGAADGSVNVLARDQLPVTLDVSVMFHLDGDQASLTPEFLQYERIQATRAVLGSNQTRTVFLPAGMTPNMLMSAPQ